MDQKLKLIMLHHHTLLHLFWLFSTRPPLIIPTCTIFHFQLLILLYAIPKWTPHQSIVSHIQQGLKEPVKNTFSQLLKTVCKDLGEFAEISRFFISIAGNCHHLMLNAFENCVWKWENVFPVPVLQNKQGLCSSHHCCDGIQKESWCYWIKERKNCPFNQTTNWG